MCSSKLKNIVNDGLKNKTHTDILKNVEITLFPKKNDKGNKGNLNTNQFKLKFSAILNMLF